MDGKQEPKTAPFSLSIKEDKFKIQQNGMHFATIDLEGASVKAVLQIVYALNAYVRFAEELHEWEQRQQWNDEHAVPGMKQQMQDAGLNTLGVGVP